MYAPCIHKLIHDKNSWVRLKKRKISQNYMKSKYKENSDHEVNSESKPRSLGPAH